MELKSLVIITIASILLLVCHGTKAKMVCVCPDQECLLERKECVLMQVLVREQEFPIGTYIKFFSGTYTVSENISLFADVFVRDTTNFSIAGDPSGSTTIQCDGRLGFSFTNVTNLTISDIQFVSCGVPINRERVADIVDLNFILEGTHAAHFLVNVHSLSVQNVNITLSYGYGILCMNLLGESHIINTSFIYNYRNRFQSPTGGSVLLHYQDTVDPPKISKILAIDNFFYASKSHDEAVQRSTRASGISVVIKQSSYCIILVVNKTIFMSNSAPTMAIYDHNMSGSYQIWIQHSYFNMSFQSNYDNLDAGSAIVMYVSVKNYVLVTVPPANESRPILANEVRNIHMIDCIFTDVYGHQYTFRYIHISLYLNVNIIIEKCTFLPSISNPALVINSVNREAYPDKFVSILACNFLGLSYGSIDIYTTYTDPVHIKIANCIFMNTNTSIVSIWKKNNDPDDRLSVIIDNTTFIHNNAQPLHIAQVSNVTIINCQFIENNNTAILCEGSKLFFTGTTYIIGNEGFDGGAISAKTTIKQSNSKDLEWKAYPSLLYLHPRARLLLINNKAINKGGGIHVESGDPYINDDHYDSCFYQLVGYNISYLPKIDFINNTAGYAGDSIYGGLSKGCILETQKRNQLKFEDFFNISNQFSQTEMASDPNTVCLCKSNATIDCRWQPHHLSYYQGQSIQLFFMASNNKNHYQEYGATPALISIMAYNAQLGKGQSAQKLGNRCSEVTFNIYSRESSVQLDLSMSGEPLIGEIDITLLGCPFGFQLDDLQYPGCICDLRIKESGCTCDIDNLTISCPFGKWIGNISHNTIVHHHCPFDYCTSERVIKITDALHDQCAYNRSGILCGKCQPELSLVLGSSKCENCSNMHLFLILLFILAGLSLVFILYSCNLTVSRGTVNGLIYFSNVVQVNSSIFVTQNTPRFLTVFIAWVNLDLGFQTCFFNGMDIYTKAWLQFIFPVYMWLIVAAIVLLSRHSMTVSRLTRDNTVPVLATLFLLSYAKLLRTIITAFSFTYLRYPDGTRLAVWMYDGNVPFVKGKHIALFIVAHVAVFGFILPYTLLLLLSPYLQRWSHYKPLRWVNKLKPFLDANHGTYKNKVRNWTGIILLIRAVQFTCFAANAEGDPNINLMVILLVGVTPYLVIWIFGTVYKSKANSILESAFILLLSTLASASLYIRTTSLDVEGKQTAITTSIFTAAFSLFLVIVAYHSFKLIKLTVTKLTKGKNILHTIMPNTSATELVSERASDQKLTAPSVSYVALSELAK